MVVPHFADAAWNFTRLSLLIGLFKDEVQKGDKSVLDAVLEDAGDLRRQISFSDQLKLDEYLDSVPRCGTANQSGGQER